MEKKYRITKNHLFKEILTKGQKFHNDAFSVYFILRPKGEIKIGIAVGKKIIKQALKRNKIKRQIREMVVDIMKEWPIDLIISIKENYVNNEYKTNFLMLWNLLNMIPLEQSK